MRSINSPLKVSSLLKKKQMTTRRTCSSKKNELTNLAMRDKSCSINYTVADAGVDFFGGGGVRGVGCFFFKDLTPSPAKESQKGFNPFTSQRVPKSAEPAFLTCFFFKVCLRCKKKFCKNIVFIVF